jgi:hypothetical protein
MKNPSNFKRGDRPVNDNFEVIQKSLDLAATMQSGIEYIRTGFAQRRFEEMLPMLQDVTQAFISIQQALSSGKAGTTSRFLNDCELRIQNGLKQLVSAYEMMDWDQASKAMEYEVVPGFMQWRQEIERYYRPAVVS